MASWISIEGDLSRYCEYIKDRCQFGRAQWTLETGQRTSKEVVGISRGKRGCQETKGRDLAGTPLKGKDIKGPLESIHGSVFLICFLDRPYHSSLLSVHDRSQFLSPL